MCLTFWSLYTLLSLYSLLAPLAAHKYPHCTFLGRVTEKSEKGFKFGTTLNTKIAEKMIIQRFDIKNYSEESHVDKYIQKQLETVKLDELLKSAVTRSLLLPRVLLPHSILNTLLKKNISYLTQISKHSKRYHSDFFIASAQIFSLRHCQVGNMFCIRLTSRKA